MFLPNQYWSDLGKFISLCIQATFDSFCKINVYNTLREMIAEVKDLVCIVRIIMCQMMSFEGQSF